jgi:PKHD-type hydroxylase
MISTYFVNKTSLDNIEPIIDVEALRNASFGDQWYLKTHETPYWVWYDNIFSETELSRVRQIGNLLNEQRGLTGGSSLNNEEESIIHRKSMVSWVNINQETDWIYQHLTKFVIDINKSWWNYDLTYIERLQYTKYYAEENGRYASHLDPLNSNMPYDRKLSFVIQMSDPEEYEGGELLIHTSNEPERIPKKKGYAIFFPSHMLHEVTPVTSGLRQSLVGWVHGPKLR